MYPTNAAKPAIITAWPSGDVSASAHCDIATASGPIIAFS